MNYYPIFEPEKWNNNKYILKSHNCYSYALNLIYPEYIEICKKFNNNDDEFCPSLKPQPGYYAGIFKKSKHIDISKRMMKDNPFIKKTTFERICPAGFYKIALCCKKDDKRYYHFYRQDLNQLWSHKNGWSKITNRDDSNKLILDPANCNRGEYDLFQGYFLVPINPSLKNMSNFHNIENGPNRKKLAKILRKKYKNKTYY